MGRLFTYGSLPLGTMVVNIVGCLAIGFLGGLSDSRGLFSSTARLFLFVGLLGGFTTFSTYKMEIFNLFQEGQAAAAFASVAIQLLFGLGAVWLGSVLAKAV